MRNRLNMRIRLALALAGWLSLATWSIHDPSLNHATRAATGNLLAHWGAITADLSIQSLGLGAIALFLPLAAWGRHIAFGEIPSRAKLRLTAWPVAVLLVAGGLSALPDPESWPLPNGFGGIMGEFDPRRHPVCIRFLDAVSTSRSSVSPFFRNIRPG